MKGILVIVGFCCAGKTTAGEYIGMKKGFKYVNIRRVFETLVGVNNAHAVHKFNCENLKNGNIEWLNFLLKKSDIFNESNFLVLEGINNYDEIEWLEDTFKVNISIVFIHNNSRQTRYMLRESVDIEIARKKLANNDSWRQGQKLSALQTNAVFQINNSEDLTHLYEKCDEVAYYFENAINLCNLCHYVNKEPMYQFTPMNIVYFIRQLGIAHGCTNECLHCFAASPNIITQTELNGFGEVINEIGKVISLNSHPLSFFHLGASTDPACVEGYSNYLNLWIDAFPIFQNIKIFTHGWNLINNPINHKELKDTLLTVNMSMRKVRFVISFDCFSKLARTNWDVYIENIYRNVKEIIDQIGKDSVRIEVFYPPERMKAESITLLEYWRQFGKNSSHPTFSLTESINLLNEFCDSNICAKITCGVITIFNRLGLNYRDLFNMARDCEMIFNSGRGRNLFRDEDARTIEEGYKIQKRRVLYSLENYCHNYEGLIIYPDGKVQFVDYLGYKLGKWVNSGRETIHSLKLM